MKNKTELNQIAIEIFKREQALSRDSSYPTLTETKRLLRHAADLMAEEWMLNFGLTVQEALRRNGMGRRKKKS